MNPINYKKLVKYLYKDITQKEIAKRFGVCLGTVEQYIKKHNLTGLKHNKPCRTDFKLTDPYFAYFVGLFITDGYYNPKTKIIEITLKNSDRKILKILSDKFNGTLKSYNGKSRLYFNRKQSKKIGSLINYTPGAKTFTATVPTNFPNLLHKYIIRGIIDGDGTIRINGEIRLYSESKNILNFFEEFLKKNSLKYSFQEKGKVISTGKGIQAGLEIYNSLPELCIERKRNRIHKLVNDIVRTYEMINRKKWCN